MQFYPRVTGAGKQEINYLSAIGFLNNDKFLKILHTDQYLFKKIMLYNYLFYKFILQIYFY